MQAPAICCRMLLEGVLDRFVKKSPLTVMARACIEHALDTKSLDALFANHAEWQYEKSLLFSSVVDVMGLVVCRVQPSIPTAFRSLKDQVGVSLSALYERLNGIEGGVSAALVQHGASRLEAVVKEMSGQLPPLVEGYRTRIIDGNHFGATERRLAVLRQSKAGPLPGQALVVLDPSLMLATHMIPCEDGRTQERALLGQVLDLVTPKDLWIADRNFCTFGFLAGIAQRHAAFASGMDIAVDETVWRRFQTMSAAMLAAALVEYAGYVRLELFRKKTRGPKKPRIKRTQHLNETHVSTGRLLARAGHRT